MVEARPRAGPPPRAGGTDRAAAGHGFTLVEMLAAIGILVFGATSLVGLLGAGVSSRSSAELRERAARAAEAVLQLYEAQLQAVPSSPGAAPAPPAPVDYDVIPGFPRLCGRVEPVLDEASPRLLLAVVRVTWQEEGGAVAELFHRVVSRAAPFPSRVAAIVNPSLPQ